MASNDPAKIAKHKDANIEKSLMILKNIGNKEWRMTSGAIYSIKTKSGEKVPFKPNKVQLELFREFEKHKKHIVVKGRQQGASTGVDIWLLDEALFNKNVSIGIIAQDLETAADIFDNKLKFAYDNLPPEIKGKMIATSDREKELSLNNGSSIRVATSFRGGTIQYLHVSEYGKICAKFPDKAREIQTGSLNSVPPDGFIVFESTAEGNDGDFYNRSQKAMDRLLNGQPLSRMDYKFHFFPWFLQDEYCLNEGDPVSEKTKNYFNRLKGETWFAKFYPDTVITEGQMRWFQKMNEDDTEGLFFQEYPSIPTEAFNIALRGTYYEKEVAFARTQNRVGEFLWDQNIAVHTAWDIGSGSGADHTSIWFFQEIDDKIHIIDFFEANDLFLTAIASTVINNKPYLYGTHFLPHDAGATEANGNSVAKTIQSVIKGNVQVIKNAGPGSVDQGIFFVKTIFGRLRFNLGTTNVGFSHLCQYRRKWNKRDGQFDNVPNHDEHSHAADAFRYLAMAICNRMTHVESYSRMLPVYEGNNIMNAVMGRGQVYEGQSMMTEYR